MTAGKRVLLIFVGLAYVAILAASLYQRFSQPTLTKSMLAAPAAPERGPMSDIGQLMQAAAANPGDKAGLIRLIRSLMAIEQWESAENFAQKALSLDDPDNPDEQIIYLLAVIHHNQGKHQEAAELLEKLLAKGDNPSARYSLGILYLHFLDQPEKGIAQLEQGLLSPKLTPALEATMREELGKARLQRSSAPQTEPETRQAQPQNTD